MKNGSLVAPVACSGSEGGLVIVWPVSEVKLVLATSFSSLVKLSLTSAFALAMWLVSKDQAEGKPLADSIGRSVSVALVLRVEAFPLLVGSVG